MLRENVPNLRLLDHVVPGGPHLDLPLVAPIEAVGHDAVLGRRLAGRHVDLHGASDAGKARHQRRLIAAADQPAQIRHRREIFGAQAGNAEQNDVVGHGRRSDVGGRRSGV